MGGSSAKTARSVLRERLRKSPRLLVPGALAWLNGQWQRCKWLLLGRRVSAGRYFRVYGPLIISGPGRVRFGDDVLIISNAIKPVVIRTLTPQARVSLGDHSGLNGTSINCVREIRIDEWSNIADAYITDSKAHSLAPDRRSKSVEEVEADPVHIGRNVWGSVSCVILDGVSIGEDSVIGACSLVRRDVPAGVLAAGNPLKVIGPVDSE